MIAFPFQSNFQGMDDHGNPIYDRAVDASFYRQREALFYQNGVFANPASNFQVVAHSGMTVRVKAGTCFVQGVTGIEVQPTDLLLDKAEELSNRTDIIVIRADFTQNRRLSVEIKKETEELRRDSDIWEIQLAKIVVPKLAASIRQQDITDTRLNTNLCGIVASNVPGFDTSALFDQIEAYMEEKKAELSEQVSNQQSQWQSQLEAQQAGYAQLKNTIQAWYDSAKADIATLQTFDFDNTAELNGARKTTSFLPSGEIEEEIVMVENLKRVASRTTRFLSGGFIKELKVYGEDGVIIKQSTSSTSFLPSGDIEEEII